MLGLVRRDGVVVVHAVRRGLKKRRCVVPRPLVVVRQSEPVHFARQALESGVTPHHQIVIAPGARIVWCGAHALRDDAERTACKLQIGEVADVGEDVRRGVIYTARHAVAVYKLQPGIHA